MPSFSWDIARGKLALPYKSFGITYRCQLQCSSSPLGLLDYQPTPHNTPEERRPQLQSGGSLQFRRILCSFLTSPVRVTCPSSQFTVFDNWQYLAKTGMLKITLL